MKKLLLLALLIAAIGAGQKTFAQELESNCVVGASITDTDPNGLNVRSKPSVSGKVLTRLKHNDNKNFVVYVIGYSNGWIKIGGANDGTQDVSKAVGWVSAKMLSVTANGADAQTKFYQKPSVDSKVVGTVPTGTAVQIVGYDCLSVKVVYQGKTGWLLAIKP